MRKTMLLLLLGITTMAEAQTETTANMVAVRPIEFEMRVGTTLPLGSIKGTDGQFGAALGVELRYNFRRVPVDVGFALDITTAVHGYKSDYSDDCQQSNRTALLVLTGDYNFRQGHAVNPFVGVAMGVGLHDALLDVLVETKGCHATVPTFSPRVGVELWRHLRLTLTSNISRKYYNNLSLTLGYVVGGGKKKK